jgi:plasmid maintenance system antidote protein VapI
MENILPFSRHGAASSIAGFKKASIGTTPPDISLKRLARPRDASFLPAKMLRTWAAEQPAASASCSTVISLDLAQRSIGCDMGTDISPRNGQSQPKIFPPEIALPVSDLLQCDMAKSDDDEPPEIHLGAWLDLFEVSVGEAADIAGCDQSYISNIIAGRKPNVNVLYLLRLSEKMGITVNDFYRSLPGRSHLAALKNLSPKAQATLLARQQKKS